MTSVASISPRLISAVSPDPARLLAAAAAELADRWTSLDYDLGYDEAVACIGLMRDALQSLATVVEPGDPPYLVNVHDFASNLAADNDPAVSAHASKRTAEAHHAMAKAVRELGAALDRYDDGRSW
jgi:hypothetical protein